MAAVFLLVLSACAKKPLELPKSVTNLYQLVAEVERASDHLQYRKIEIPARIQERLAYCRCIYDRSRVIVQLIDDSKKDSVDREVGLYDFETGEYKRLFLAGEDQSFVGADQSFDLLTCNEKYLIFKAVKDGSEDIASLFGYAFETGEMFDIYTYSLDDFMYGSNNSVLLVENTLWLDDLSLTEQGEFFVDLYTYDLDNRTLEKRERNAQNAMLHKGKVHYFVQDEQGEFDDIKTYGEEERIHVKDNLYDIGAIDQEIYCITGETNEAKEKTIYRIKEMLSGKEILSTDNNRIDQLKATEYFVTWKILGDAAPLIYDVKAKKLLLFEDLDAHHNRYLIKDNYGILFRFFPDGSIDYYFFESKK